MKLELTALKIPADVSALPGSIPASSRITTPVAVLQGLNSWTGGRTTGYRGPAPPAGHGTHHYHFKVYALDAELNIAPGQNKQQVLDAMQGHVLATGELVGTCER